MRTSRRSRLRDWLAERPGGVIVERELRQLQTTLGAAAPRTLHQLAEELHRLGARVRYGDLTGGEEDRLFSLASLGALASELRQAQQRLAAAQQAGDLEAVTRLRAAARRGRQRALRVAGSARVAADDRRARHEMADWLLLWLEMPEAFFEWLEVRQRTEEFRSLCKSG